MKPKEALLKGGRIQAITRGRISAENHAWLAQKAGEGWAIDGYTIKKPETPNTAPVVEKSERRDPGAIVDIPDEARSENDWQAYRHEDGKPVDVGMRECCNTCRASLTYCRCETPKVWVDVDAEAVVYFKPRTTPLPKRRW